MKIYTKTGDRGKTSLFNGTRVSKDNIRLETYGTFDELSSILGVASAFLTKEKKLQKIIQQIQQDLLDIGGHLADPTNVPADAFIAHLDKRVSTFEQTIDTLTLRLKPLTNFIIFTGNKSASFLQHARTVARRSERRLVTLSQTETVDGSFLRYFNRLSDLLYTISRFANRHEKGKEIVWRKFGS